MTIGEKILQEYGPLMSSDLAKKIEHADSITYNTASQRVARDKQIGKIKGFFVSNQSLCYLSIHEQNGLLLEILIKSLYENGRKYWYCLNALRLHGGIISKQYLECYTNYPVIPLKKHLPFDTVMRNFVAQGVLVFNGNDYLFSPRLSQIHTTSLTYRTIEVIKNDIITTFNSLTKNIGLISYNTGEQFGEFGKFRWAFKGVSTVTGLMQNGKPGFLLADILIGTSIYEDDVRFFIEKINHIQSFTNAPRIIPFMIVDDLDKKALDLLKRHGITIGFIGELFGQKYAETLKELVTILTNAGACLKKTPDKYLDLIEELKKYNEGLINNIRGTLFEYMVGHIHSVHCQSIDLGREIFDSTERHEMDILATYNDKIVIAECKATKSQIDIKVINKWIDKKIPAFKGWFDKQETYKKKKLEFEFWSTSGFKDDALERLKKYSESSQKFKVSYYQAAEMREKARIMDNKKLKEALDNFFLKINV
jgi:hypothetical protein